jgi:hypothetical protein
MGTIAAAGEVRVVDSVPEPSTFILLGSGLAGVLGLGRKWLFETGG